MNALATTTSPPTLEKKIDQWSLQSEEDPTDPMAEFMLSWSSMDDIDDLSLDDDDLSLDRPTKRVSWGDQVQVREYQGNQWNDCPSCSMDHSQERCGEFVMPPPKLRSLGERQQRIFEEIEANLEGFEEHLDSVDKLMKDMDDLLLSAVEIPDLPIFKTTTGSSSTAMPLPKSLAAYDEFFASEVPIVSCQRVVPSAC